MAQNYSAPLLSTTRLAAFLYLFFHFTFTSRLPLFRECDGSESMEKAARVSSRVFVTACINSTRVVLQYCTRALSKPPKETKKRVRKETSISHPFPYLVFTNPAPSPSLFLKKTIPMKYHSRHSNPVSPTSNPIPPLHHPIYPFESTLFRYPRREKVSTRGAAGGEEVSTRRGVFRCAKERVKVSCGAGWGEAVDDTYERGLIYHVSWKLGRGREGEC